MRPADWWLIVTGLGALGMMLFGSQMVARFAPFVGLSAQPVWMTFAVEAKSIGVAIIVAAYTAMWAGGCLKSILRWRGRLQ